MKKNAFTAKYKENCKKNDAILTDTMDDLDLYNENYLHDVLVCYYGELETILAKAVTQ